MIGSYQTKHFDNSVLEPKVHYQRIVDEDLVDNMTSSGIDQLN